MLKYQKVEIYGTTVVFLVEPTKVEFELMYHDKITSKGLPTMNTSRCIKTRSRITSAVAIPLLWIMATLWYVLRMR